MKKSILLYTSILLSTLLAVPALAQTTGLLYGMTYNGGGAATPYGEILGYDPINNMESVLFSFGNPSLAHPYGSLVQALDGQLYGMTYGGGGLFSYNPSNALSSVRFYFTGTNGSLPTGSLIQAKDSLLYGMTSLGGTSNEGVLFSYNISTGKDSVRFSFSGLNGKNPGGSLLQAKDGKLYGMAELGGSSDSGVIFSYDPKTGKDTVLVNMNKTTGAYPIYGSLVQDTNGLLYGMTAAGGFGGGVLFSYNPISGKDTVLVNFTALTGNIPQGSLIHDTNGILYGMTNGGGGSNGGTLFSYAPVTSTYTVLFNFSSPTGASPYGTPMLASNGLLYGMTIDGGISSAGTIFNYNLTTHTETKLVDFTGLNGANPYGDLIEAMVVNTTGLDSISCNGDSNGWAKINVRGAKMPVSYLWGNGSTIDSIGGLKAGKYTCKIKDSRGITIMDTIIIFQPLKLILSPNVSNVCFGDSNGVARTNASGGTKPYTYKWNNGATTDTISGLKPGKDTCIVTDARGCSASAAYIITQASPLKIDSIVYTPATWPTYSNGTATVWVSGGTPKGDSNAYFYVWTYGTDTLIGPQPARYSTVINLTAGTDSVCITSGYYECGSICTAVNIPLGITSLNAYSNSVKIYPVPSSGQLSVYLQGVGFKLITISDELGREVYRSVLDASRNNYTLPLDIRAEANGIYIAQIITEKETITRKLVIQK